MKVPARMFSVPWAIRLSMRILRRVQAIPGMESAVTAFQAAVDRLVARQDQCVASRQQASASLESLNEAADALDEQLRDVGLTLISMGRGRRKSEAYRRYFPKGYGSALKRDPESSLAITAGILAQMDNETSDTILRKREPLTGARSSFEAARTRRQESLDAVDVARANLETEKASWRKALNVIYLTLRAELPDRRRFVEAIFADPGNQTGEEDEDPAKETENVMKPEATEAPVAGQQSGHPIA